MYKKIRDKKPKNIVYYNNYKRQLGDKKILGDN